MHYRAFIRKSALRITALAAVCLLVSCSATFVAPYDEQLITGTETFYKQAAELIEAGRAASPRDDDARNAIADPANHAAHYSRFEARYNQLIIDSEALILRAVTSADAIDLAGREIQEELDRLIETTIPADCEEAKREFGRRSLTASNFIDLKCIITQWKAQHADEVLTGGTMILKKANWEGRKRTIFHAVLAIQQAESSKQPDAGG